MFIDVCEKVEAAVEVRRARFDEITRGFVRGERVRNRAHRVELLRDGEVVWPLLRPLKEHVLQEMRYAADLARFVIRACAAHHEHRHGVRALHGRGQDAKAVCEREFFEHTTRMKFQITSTKYIQISKFKKVENIRSYSLLKVSCKFSYRRPLLLHRVPIAHRNRLVFERLEIHGHAPRGADFVL